MQSWTIFESVCVLSSQFASIYSWPTVVTDLPWRPQQQSLENCLMCMFPIIKVTSPRYVQILLLSSDPVMCFFCFHRADSLELLCISIQEKKKQHLQCFISTESVLQQLIYSSLMCSMSSYLKHSELEALVFGLAGSFSISNPFILKLEIKILTFTRWKYQLFLLTEKPANSGLLNLNQNALGVVSVDLTLHTTSQYLMCTADTAYQFSIVLFSHFLWYIFCIIS